MTLQTLYRSFLQELSDTYSSREAAEITTIIFEFFAGADRAFVIKNPNHIPGEKAISDILESLEALKMSKPVQYITGETWFYKMKLKVSAAVLIPRPETEELLEAVLHAIKKIPAPRVIDIGTGSGCLAIGIKKYAGSANVTAIDVSPEALMVASANAAGQGTDINFLQLDFLSEKSWQQLDIYDLIVSNPPYIPETEIEKTDKNVAFYEPHLALFVKQPLIFYKAIAAFGKKHLKPKGMIFMETHEYFAEAVRTLFADDHYEAIIKKDLFGKQRFVIATRCR